MKDLGLVIVVIMIMVLLVIKNLAFIPVVPPNRYVEFLFTPVVYLAIRGGWKLALIPWILWMHFRFIVFHGVLHYDVFSLFSITIVLFGTEYIHQFFQEHIKNNLIDFYFTVIVVATLRVFVGVMVAYLDGMYSRLGIDIFTFHFIYRLFVEKILWEILFTVFVISILKKYFPEIEE